MSIRITDAAMTSDLTGHRAVHDGDGWRVTWLPGRRLAHGQALTAMTIAETLAADDPPSGCRLWPHLAGWAAELGLSGVDAAARVCAALADGEDRS